MFITVDGNNVNVDDIDNGIKHYVLNFTDVLFAFPIITLNLLSSFNVASLCTAIIDPTRKHTRFAIDSAVIACFTLMQMFGVAGYLCESSSVRGNVLLNFLFDDHLVVTVRIGCGIAIALALPVVLLPCKEAIFDIITHVSSCHTR